MQDLTYTAYNAIMWHSKVISLDWASNSYRYFNCIFAVANKECIRILCINIKSHILSKIWIRWQVSETHFLCQMIYLGILTNRRTKWSLFKFIKIWEYGSYTYNIRRTSRHIQNSRSRNLYISVQNFPSTLCPFLEFFYNFVPCFIINLVMCCPLNRLWLTYLSQDIF